MIFVLSRWTVKVSAFSGMYFWSYSDRQQEEQNNQFIQCLYIRKENYRHSFNRSLLLSTMGYRIGTCVILFIMNWDIQQGTDLA